MSQAFLSRYRHRRDHCRRDGDFGRVAAQGIEQDGTRLSGGAFG